MSAVERLALRVQLPGFAGPTLDPATRRLLGEGLGGVCLFGTNTERGPDAVAALVADVRRAGTARTVVAVDEEGGDVTRLHQRDASPSPGAAVLGAVDDPGWTREVGAEVAAGCARLGIDLVLAPVADVNSEPDNPVIGVRSLGADPARVAVHVAAWVAGAQSAGVSACAKHFPGHGDTRQDSHATLPRVEVDAATLRDRELVPFRAAVGAGVDAVMTAHLVAPAVDPHRPASLSPAAYRLLRDDLGFGGLAVTDALDMAGASAGRGVPEAAVQALAAGADLLCLGQASGEPLVGAVQRALVDAVRDGRLPEERLAEAAARVDALPRRAPRPGGAGRDHTARVRRALRLDGALPELRGAVSVRVDTEPSVAVGPVPWGLPADLAVVPDDPGAGDRVLARAAGAPVVAQARDAHRHPAVVRLVERLADAGPVVVVEWGWPGPWPAPWPERLTRLCAWGTSVPGHAAVLGLLQEHGYARGGTP